MSGWVVHKFGGTSVANLERIQRVASIVRAEPGENKAIVVSALAGVTDALHELAERAAKPDWWKWVFANWPTAGCLS